MALKFQGGKATEAAHLAQQLMDKVQSLRMMGGRDKNLDTAMQKARECQDALGNFLAGE